ncbi:hypothetical protein B0T17DRAFT_611284 [Bombardia bombarda]|uniref:CFEM domain-containing protein n=1 Tax=Bombardia bombarda TaxID=252184 RepID=A0AA40CEB0_9PEZI|nr:hypothetical protein B0T17DRAFT_611284 [Bombardia bombarda]
MQYSTVLLAILSSAVSSSALAITEAPAPAITAAPAAECTLTGLMPDCGVPCIASAAANIGCTDVEDFACQCKSAAAMQAAVMPCVVEACGTATAPVVGSVANAICTECVAPATATAVV